MFIKPRAVGWSVRGGWRVVVGPFCFPPKHKTVSSFMFRSPVRGTNGTHSQWPVPRTPHRGSYHRLGQEEAWLRTTLRTTSTRQATTLN